MNLTKKVIIFFILIVSLCGIFAEYSFSEVLQEITVKGGDTLWGVANYYMKDPRKWPEILKHNKLPSSDPNVILPGMKIRVPILLIKESLRAAHLIYLLNDVRYRRSREAEWKRAKKNMELYNDDGLRTLQQSRARVKFFSGEILHLDENSLIILKPEKKQEEVNLLSGGVRASRTKVLARDSEVTPRIEPKGPKPDFRTKIKADRTTLVEVYAGIVDVTAQGKTVTLTKGFGTEVKFRKPPSLPHKLPPSPELTVDEELEGNVPGTDITTKTTISKNAMELNIEVPKPVYTGRSDDKPSQQTTPKQTVTQKSEEKQSRLLSKMITKYHIQISTSRKFGKLVVDEIDKIKGKIKVDFKKYNLKDGRYYYRLAYMDEMGFEGKYSTPVTFLIDTTAPFIDVTTPVNEQEVDSEFIYVEGKTEKGSVLEVNNKNVKVDDKGVFTTALTPKKGENIINFMAKDRSGNVTNKKMIVYKVKVARKTGRTKSKQSIKEKGSKFISTTLGIMTGLVILGVVVLILG